MKKSPPRECGQGEDWANDRYIGILVSELKSFMSLL